MSAYKKAVTKFKKGYKKFAGSDYAGEGQWKTINGHPVFIKGGTGSVSKSPAKSSMNKGVPKKKKRLSNAAWWNKALAEDEKKYVKGMKSQFGKKAFKPFGDVGNRIYD